MRSKLFPALLAALMVLPSLGAQEPTSWRLFEVGNLRLERDRRGGPPVRLPLNLAYEAISEGSSGTRWPETVGLSRDRVVDMVRESVAPESWELEGVALQLVGGNRLLAFNQEAVLDEIGAYLSYLESAVMPSVQAEVHLIPSGAARTLAGQSVIDAERASKLLAASGAKPVAQMTLKGMASGDLDIGDTLTFVGDYDVEVAQEKEMADPLVVALREGLDLRLQALSDGRGGHLVRVTARVSAVEAVRKQQVGSYGLGFVQLPLIGSQITVASACVPGGGALVVGSAEGDDDRVLLIRVTARQPEQARPDWVQVIPTGFLGIDAQLMPPLDIGPPGHSGRDQGGKRDAIEPPRVMEGDALVEMIRVRVSPQLWDEEPNYTLTHVGNHILAKAPPKEIQAIRQLVGELQKSLLGTVQLEVRAGYVPTDVAQAASRGEEDLASLAGRLTSQGYISAIQGDTFRLVRGQELAYLRDHDVEIAQDAGICDPVVDTLFAGLAFQGRVQGQQRGGMGLTGEFVVQDLVGEIVPFDGDTDDMGVVETPRTTAARARVAASLENNRWTTVSISPVLGNERSLVFLVRARF